jgi:signal peptidase I
MTVIRRIIFFGGAFLDLAKTMIVLAILVILTHYFLGTVFVVDGVSMEPNFRDGQIVWSNKIGYLLGDPGRGESVVVLYPGDPENKKYIKRIIGLPNEKVRINNGRIYITDAAGEWPLAEDYLDQISATFPEGSWQLNNGEYFLMGDNRRNSNDSRYFGAVERRFIFGKVTTILWPDFKSVD